MKLLGLRERRRMHVWGSAATRRELSRSQNVVVVALQAQAIGLRSKGIGVWCTSPWLRTWLRNASRWHRGTGKAAARGLFPSLFLFLLPIFDSQLRARRAGVWEGAAPGVRLRGVEEVGLERGVR